MFLDTSASRHIWSVHVVSIHGLPQFQPVAPFYRAIMFNVTITCNNLWVLWTVNLWTSTVSLTLWDSHMWQISKIFKVSFCWQFEQWAEWLSTSSRPPLMKMTWPLLEVWLSSWSTCSSWRSSIEGTKKNRTECFKMTAYVRTINGKTISMKCNRQQISSNDIGDNWKKDLDPTSDDASRDQRKKLYDKKKWKTTLKQEQRLKCLWEW